MKDFNSSIVGSMRNVDDSAPLPQKGNDSRVDVLDILINAIRIGSDKDEPEGSRYIMLSDTLVKNMIRAIKDERTRTDR